MQASRDRYWQTILKTAMKRKLFLLARICWVSLRFSCFALQVKSILLEVLAHDFVGLPQIHEHLVKVLIGRVTQDSRVSCTSPTQSTVWYPQVRYYQQQVPADHSS